MTTGNSCLHCGDTWPLHQLRSGNAWVCERHRYTEPPPERELLDEFCFDRDGNHISFARYLELAAVPGYRILARDHVGDVMVSTVWLGLDIHPNDEERVLFESMVFGGPMHGERWLYATDQEARAGHESMLLLLGAGVK